MWKSSNFPQNPFPRSLFYFPGSPIASPFFLLLPVFPSTSQPIFICFSVFSFPSFATVGTYPWKRPANLKSGFWCQAKLSCMEAAIRLDLALCGSWQGHWVRLRPSSVINDKSGSGTAALWPSLAPGLAHCVVAVASSGMTALGWVWPTCMVAEAMQG